MGKIGTIIFLVIVIWQVVSAILEQTSKKQQSARMKELELQRRQQAAAQKGTGGGPRQPAARTPGAMKGEDLTRTETLAARRQAQIEELRRRRLGRSGSPGPVRTASPTRAQTQVRTGPVTASPPTAFPAPAASVDIATWRAQQATDERTETARKVEVVQQKKEQQRVRQQEYRAQVERREPHGLVPHEHDHYDTPAKRRDVAAELRAKLGSRRTIRQLFLLKELLDAPVAMRAEDLGF